MSVERNSFAASGQPIAVSLLPCAAQTDVSSPITYISQMGLRDMPGGPYGPGVVGMLGELTPLLLLLPAVLPPAKCTKCCARFCRCWENRAPPGMRAGLLAPWPGAAVCIAAAAAAAAAAELSTLMWSLCWCAGVRGTLLKLADLPTGLPVLLARPALAAAAATSELLPCAGAPGAAAAAAWPAWALAAAAIKALVLLATRLGTDLKALRGEEHNSDRQCGGHFLPVLALKLRYSSCKKLIM
jgi:hypothetical protein